MERPFSQACENNKDPILNILREHFSGVGSVLEIGSGTGQHAVYFAQNLPHLEWQCSDRGENLPGINSWLQWAGLENTPLPLELDVNNAWEMPAVPAVFSANTLHIMSWAEVEKFFLRLDSLLGDGGVCVVYGPFNYQGQFTSESNARFDQWLKSRDPLSGIRDFEAVNALATRAHMRLINDYAMPANNRCIVWRKELAQ